LKLRRLSRLHKQPTQLYFAYGANMSLNSMLGRCPSAQPVERWYLKDWQLEFASHATVTPKTGSVVAGALWCITADCERRLDRFEGFPDYYTKTHVEQHGRRFMLYVMCPPLVGQPSSSYVSCLRDGYNDWQLDHDLLDQALGNSHDIDYYDLRS
jgi:gamma-glutamylcyclotransferase (GGCT)/AIG2-like uncharacterized protein YtfP